MCLPRESFDKANMMEIEKRGLESDWNLKIIELRSLVSPATPWQGIENEHGSNLFNFLFFSNSIRERKSMEKVFSTFLYTQTRKRREKSKN